MTGLGTAFESDREYEQWVEKVAWNNLTRDGSPAEHVATVCLIATERVGDEMAILFNAEPYAKTRTSPSEVIRHHDEYPLGGNRPDDLRGLAVSLLADDIEDAMLRLDGVYENGVWMPESEVTQ